MPNLFEELANKFFKRHPSQDGQQDKKLESQEAVMTDEDLKRAEALMAECQVVELEQLYVATHA
jgi:hypothetical protein